MIRVDLPTKTVDVVSKAVALEDLKRGYTVLQLRPEGELIIRNPRNLDKPFVRKKPAVLLFRCMRCQFDAVDGDYNYIEGTGVRRQGLDVIKAHLEQGRHDWPYPSYENPYGNEEDVIIEGVEDYQKEL